MEMSKEEFRRWVTESTSFAFVNENVTALDGRAVMAIASRIFAPGGPVCNDQTKVAILGAAFNMLVIAWPERATTLGTKEKSHD